MPSYVIGIPTYYNLIYTYIHYVKKNRPNTIFSRES